jgi:carboxylesterase
MLDGILIARYNHLTAAILKGSQPIFIQGNSVGILLLHGFTASPYEMKALGEYLNQNGGFTISIPLLAGHGKDTETLNSVHWNEWINSAVVSYEKLKLHSSKIFVIGMSMGGSIALNFASKFKIDGLICMGTPTYITRLSCIARVLYPVIKSLKKKGGSDIADLEAKKNIVSLKTIPLHALIEFRKLLKDLKSKICYVECPIYLMHSKNDHTIKFDNMEIISKSVASKTIKIKAFEKSFHILPLDLESDVVFSESLGFIKSLI